MKSKLATTSLPVDTAQWGELMVSEAVQRLEKVHSLIKGFRLVSSDEEGNGLGLIILEGGRVFIPVVAKDWKIEPIDTLIYKHKNETKFAYLSERVLLNLLVTSSVGVPVGPLRGGRSDAAINMFTPAGGYGARVANPWSPFYSSTTAGVKSASYDEEFYDDWTPSRVKTAFTLSLLGNEDYWLNNKDISEVVHNITKPEPTQFGIVEKTAGMENSYTLYSTRTPEGLQIDEEKLKTLMNMIEPDQRERTTKTASLFSGDSVLFGQVLDRKDMVFLKPKFREEQRKEHSIYRSSPQAEGVYYVCGDPVYYNPRTIDIDGEATDLKLIVGQGYHAVDTELNTSYENPHTVDSALLTRDSLMKPSKGAYKVGDVIVIYDRVNTTVTLPMKVILPMRNDVGDLSMKVQGLYGNPNPILIKFYNGTNIVNRGTEVLFPSSLSVIYKIPETTKDETDRGSSFGVNGDKIKSVSNIMVDITCGAGGLFDIYEDNKFKKRCKSKSELLYFLMTSYSLGLQQAKALGHRIKFEKTVRMSLTKKVVIPEKNTTRIEPSMRVKEALRSLIGLASGISRAKFANAVDMVRLRKTFDSVFTKMAAAGDLSNGNTSGAGYKPTGSARAGESAESQVGSQAGGSGKGQLLQALLQNSTPATRNTQEIIDLLTFYALGQYKEEESLKILIDIEESLKQVENSLAKTLLLSQLDRVPGIDYSDAKLLLSDIDGFLSRILSSKVLIKNI